jgi:hypothetical protein
MNYMYGYVLFVFDEQPDLRVHEQGSGLLV